MRRHHPALRGMLRRLCGGDTALADDLAQDAFVQAWRALPSFRGEARFSTWLYRIGWNAFLAHARARQPDVDPLDDADGIAAPAIPLAHATAMKLDLERALARLPLAQRAALVQCYYHDLSHEEAAFVLGCPVGTVKTHVRRGRERLRGMLDAWNPPR